MLTRRQSREVDRIAIETLGFSSLVLMENAGRGAVDTMQGLGAVKNGTKIAVVCGKGNNGGDGLVMARHFKIRGADPTVFLLARPDELSGDAKANFEILRHCDVPVLLCSELPPENSGEFETRLRKSTVLVDAILGTGAAGAPREPFAEAIRLLNKVRRETAALLFAVDIPSGLDADTGKPDETTIRADHTLTFFSEKVGFAVPDALSFLGNVHVHDIGIPPFTIQSLSSGGSDPPNP